MSLGNVSQIAKKSLKSADVFAFVPSDSCTGQDLADLGDRLKDWFQLLHGNAKQNNSGKLGSGTSTGSKFTPRCYKFLTRPCLQILPPPPPPPPPSPGQEPCSQLQGLHRLDVFKAGHRQRSVSGPVRADGHQPGQVRGLHQTLLQLLRHLQGRQDLHGWVVPVLLERKWVCGEPHLQIAVKNQCWFYVWDHSLYTSEWVGLRLWRFI